MPAPFFFEPISDSKNSDIIRVNHAGEYAAKMIYEGQLKYIKNEKEKQIISEMLANEEEHLKFFTKELINRDIRPTILSPVWKYLSYFLGAGSSLFGIREAMLVTVAVEDVIEQHYHEQINSLSVKNIEHELTNNIKQFMLDEVHHGEIALSYLANLSKFAKLRQKIIAIGCKVAISLSKKF